MSQAQQKKPPHAQSQNPAQIQDEIAHTRSEIDETLGAMEQRLSPDMLMQQAEGYLRGSGGRKFLTNLSESARRNPVPTVLIGVGVAWLMMAGRKGRSSAGAGIEASRQAAVRDKVEREGLTREDHEARKHPPNSGVPRSV